MTYPGYDFRAFRASIAGQQMHYVAEGPSAAEPVVMLHGNPTWSFYYRTLIARLCDRYRVIAPDHVGMGLSSRPRTGEYDYTLARRVDDIDRLLEQLGIVKDVTLVVHDWGGPIGFGWAARHPERVRRLVILNTAAFHLPPGHGLPWQLRAVRTAGVGELMVRGLNLFCRDALRMCVAGPRLSESVRQAYLGPYDSWDARVAVYEFVKDIPTTPNDRAYSVLSEIERSLDKFKATPALVCWGMKDFVFDARILDQWRKHLPAAEVHSFPDAGHYLLEDAGSDVALRVRAFLEENPIHA